MPKFEREDPTGYLEIEKYIEDRATDASEALDALYNYLETCDESTKILVSSAIKTAFEAAEFSNDLFWLSALRGRGVTKRKIKVSFPKKQEYAADYRRLKAI